MPNDMFKTSWAAIKWYQAYRTCGTTIKGSSVVFNSSSSGSRTNDKSYFGEDAAIYLRIKNALIDSVLGGFITKSELHLLKEAAMLQIIRSISEQEIENTGKTSQRILTRSESDKIIKNSQLSVLLDIKLKEKGLLSEDKENTDV